MRLLLRAFTYIARREGFRRLALIDVGASAGLKLIWDRYAYDYGSGSFVRSMDALVRIETEIEPSCAAQVTPSFAFRR